MTFTAWQSTASPEEKKMPKDHDSDGEEKTDDVSSQTESFLERVSREFSERRCCCACENSQCRNKSEYIWTIPCKMNATSTHLKEKNERKA